MSSLLTTTSGDDSGGTTILIAHHNNIIMMLNGTQANLVKMIHNDANAFQVVPAASGYVAAQNWLQLQNNAAAEVLAIHYNGQIRSSLATGTAPLVITSTTKVANLNADQVDGLDTSATAGGTLMSTTGTETASGKTFTAPTIADFTNAAHDHGDADDGGAIIAAALGLTTAGDLLYRNATVNARLPIGTAGQALITNAAANAPEWGALYPPIKDLTGSLTAVSSATFATIVSWTFTAPLAGQVVVFFHVHILSTTTNGSQGEVELQIGGVTVALNARGQEPPASLAITGNNIFNSDFAAVTALNSGIRAAGDDERAYYIGTAVATVAAGSNTLVWRGRNVGGVTNANLHVYSMAVVGRTS